MANTLQYGDTVTLQNGHNTWTGGYLDTYGKGPAGARFGVLTADTPNRHPQTGKWVIESGSGKAKGTEVISGDSILLKNLFDNGSYLYVHALATAPSKMTVATTSPATPAQVEDSRLKWRIFADTSSSQDSKVRAGDAVKLLSGLLVDNSTDNGGFLDVSGNVATAGLKYWVSTSHYADRAGSGTALWKLSLAE